MLKREMERKIMDNSPQLCPKLYVVNPLLKVISIIVALFLVGLICLPIWGMISGPFAFPENLLATCLIVICLLGIFAVFIYWNDRLEVSHEGVAYYGLGFRVYTPWQNIVGITRVRHAHAFLVIRPVNAFVFRSPALLNIQISEGKRRGIAVIEKHWLVFPKKLYTYNSYLPLFISERMASGDLSQHELGTYIRAYAPHIDNL